MNNETKTISNGQVNLLLSGYTDTLNHTSFDQMMDVMVKIADETVKSNDFDDVCNSIRKFIVSNLKSIVQKYVLDNDLADSKLFMDQVCALFFAHPLFLNVKENDLQDAGLYEWYASCRNKALLKKDFRYAPKMIVSFTSFPARIHVVYKTLSSIYEQTMLPDKVILWLAKPQFPNLDADLPESLLAYKKLGLEIRWVDEDIRPHKKYYYVN